MRKPVLLLASMALALLLVSGVVWADTFTVKNEKDSGPGSLRAAITSANAEPGRDVITFSPSVRGEINLKSQLPMLRGELGIRGPGASKLTVRRTVYSKFRIFVLAKGNPTVTISGLTVSNGAAPLGDGGGILNQDGDLTLRGVVIRDNDALQRDGGGIANQGDGHLMVEGSTITGNSAIRDGSGIANLGTAVIRNSALSGNRAGESGGGIYNQGGTISGTTLTVEGSTFSGNSGARGGGIYNNQSTLMIRNSTFSGNSAPGDVGDGGGAILNVCGNASVVGGTISGNSSSSIGRGGGISNYRDPGVACDQVFRLRGTIVAKNESPEGPDAFGTFSSGGYNLIGNPSGSSGFGGTDLTSTRSGLDPRGLRDNGGPTKTIALVSSSPAVDAVPRTVCPPPATDQRGVRRPQDGDGDGAARCDIGAYERRTTAQ